MSGSQAPAAAAAGAATEGTRRSPPGEVASSMTMQMPAPLRTGIGALTFLHEVIRFNTVGMALATSGCMNITWIC